jgi:hypothetical protein
VRGPALRVALCLLGLAVGASLVLAGNGTPQGTAPEPAGWAGQVRAVLETIPPEQRIWAVGIGAALVGWVLWLRFGRDGLARRQRDALSGIRDPLTAEERRELKEVVRRRVEKREDSASGPS